MIRLISILIVFFLIAVQLPAQKDILKKDRNANTVPQEIIINPEKAKPLPDRLKKYDFTNLKFCVDQIGISGVHTERDFSKVAPLPKINSDGSLEKIGVKRQPLAGETNKMWDPGQTLRVFLEPANSTVRMRVNVMNFAREWEQWANIRFDFVEQRAGAHIRVGFEKGWKNFSMIGKDALLLPDFMNTMNFDELDSYSEREVRTVVLHEFGHALGYIHEHQSPAAGINWDKEKVYAFFEQQYKWSRLEVDINLFHKYSATSTNFSAYDPLSIMHYYIPPELTTDGKGTTQNNDFSATDMLHTRMMYPFPPSPVNASGIFRTGNDCDEIAFRVEYNVVPKDQVEITLSLGAKNGRNVTWWKQVGIPLTGNRQKFLWVQNHSLIKSENRTTVTERIPAAEIDRARALTLWKAKMLGIHTLVNDKWNIWEAIPGGTRITLVWNNDSCL